MLPFCVYVLFSEKDSLLYIGFTTNIDNRLKDHHAGGTTSTKHRRPLKLIFTEFYMFEEDARNREVYFKTSPGKRALNLMLRTTFEKLEYKSIQR
jgi:putative endonuclease